MQRLRIKFSRGEEAKFISHLDIMRMWERVFRRAGIELAYSEGFSPHPRISLAVPLAVGVTSEAELMDVYLEREVSPHWFISSVNRQLPGGFQVLAVQPVALNSPSLQSQASFAFFRVMLETEYGPPDVQKAVEELLNREDLPWFHHRDTGKRNYDLRPLIDDIHVIEILGRTATLEMKLRCDSRGAGRPEQVALALGFTSHPVSINRTGLILSAHKKVV